MALKGGVIYRQFAPYDDQFHESDEENVDDKDSKKQHPDIASSEKKNKEDDMGFDEKMDRR